MRNVLVAGAAGGVGEGIVRALLARVPDVRVIATSRDPARLALLRERVGDDARLAAIVGNAGDPDAAVSLAQQIRGDYGGLEIAIPSLGGWWEGGPFLGVDAATWDRVMTEMLTTHVVFARVFIPELLRVPGGRYLGIGGGAALRPIRNASIVSIAAAAQLMMTRTLALELRKEPVRIEELVVDGPVRTRDSEPIAEEHWITADQIGEVVASLVRDERPAWPRMRHEGALIVMEPPRRAKTSA
jgi:NAD(P)-dependent dehydrogenase (short-subunit alcohol dehydrogenase family)